MGNSIPSYSQPLTVGGQISVAWYNFWSGLSNIALKVAGVFNSTFQSGQIQYSGPNGTLAGSNNFIVGTKVPNPSGTPGPFLLLGSGGGNGTPVSCWIGTDQAFDALTPGNTLGITAGETQGSGTANGGLLWLIGGGSFGGTGGTLQLQGGTSFNGAGGITVVQGGNATNAGGPPGDTYISAGQVGSQGANVHLIMTTVNGTAGVVRIRNNSTPLIDFFGDGSIYLYNGGGFGTVGQHITSQGPGQPVIWA